MSEELKFKKLSVVEEVQEVSDTAKVFVEYNGKIFRTSLPNLLANSEVVGEVSSTAHVFVEEDGEIKKVPKYKVGAFEILVVHSHYDEVDGDGSTHYDPISQEDYMRIYNALKNDIPVSVVELNDYRYINDDGLEWCDKNQYTSAYYIDLYNLANDNDYSEWNNVIYVYNYNYGFYIYPDGTIEID